MNWTAADIPAIILAIVALLGAYVALRKASQDSWVASGQEWRDLVALHKKQIDGLMAEMAQLKTSLKEKDVLLVELQGKYNELLTRHTDLQNRFDALSKQSTEHVTQITQLGKDNAALQREINLKTEEVQGLNIQIASLRALLAEEKMLREELQGRVDGVAGTNGG